MAKIRSAPHPSAGHVFPPPQAAGRAGRRRRPRSIGRRRGTTSPFALVVTVLFRRETLGAALVILAALAIPWLVPFSKGASSIRDDLVQAVGLHVFLIVAVLGALGWLVLRRILRSTLAHWQSWLAGGLGAVFLLGLFGLFRPDWKLGQTSLSEVTAGGDLGHALASTGLGILIWLACGVGAVIVCWPRTSRHALARSPHAAAVVWRWHIPQHVWKGLQSLLQAIFPTRAVPPPKPRVPVDTLMWARTASTTLPPEPEAAAPPAPAAEAGAPSDFGWQTELPLPGQEDGAAEAAPLLPAAAHLREVEGGWLLPPLDLLTAIAPQEDVRPDNAARAQLIVDTLASFGVDIRVVQVNEGPTVTQFGIEPGWEVKTRLTPERDGSGRPVMDRDGKPKTTTEEVSRTRVRVSQITSLSNDLALALATPSIRIEAPVPGKSVVGIEVPNSLTTLVTLRSVIESAPFQRLGARSKLALALGKSVAGEPVAADLAKMPHLLIAGATGSGKSVCINSIIACLLMHASPTEVRLIMVDPKRVELAAFARIPHLAFSSIVVDLDKVVGTLQAVIHEMESRYRRFASLAVRNIDAFNRHPRAPFRMPFWVVIIDELADLMMAAPYEVERQICRLAQLARATGIHLVIATQRPSVDVVTGLIKANFPTRIAFAVSSQVDSRTILDGAGAEKLIGRGDMLYMPTDAAKPKRLQGVFVSDQEIDRLVNFWTQERFREVERPVYDHLLEEAKPAVDELTGAEDPLLDRARELAAEHNRVSTSLLQRRLRIGYPRAARLMDMLEDEGVIGPAEGGGSREVYLDRQDPDEEL
jgi:S-DNA-T family DNA segregation ATPase FtsK/SpoIIIE